MTYEYAPAAVIGTAPRRTEHLDATANTLRGFRLDTEAYPGLHHMYANDSIQILRTSQHSRREVRKQPLFTPYSLRSSDQ